MNGRKSHEKKSGNANQDEREQDAHHVSARADTTEAISSFDPSGLSHREIAD
jgi:hypothetical protein